MTFEHNWTDKTYSVTTDRSNTRSSGRFGRFLALHYTLKHKTKQNTHTHARTKTALSLYTKQLLRGSAEAHCHLLDNDESYSRVTILPGVMTLGCCTVRQT